MDANYADLENAPSLNLDYHAVMSSWEKMGRNASGGISGGNAAAMGGSGELPLDLSFLEGKGFGEDSNERDPLDIFTFCDLFDADDLTFSSAPPQQQRRSPDGVRAAAAAAAAAAGVVPGSAPTSMLPRANSDMMVPCCERAGSGSLMPTFEQSAAVSPDQYPTYEQYMHAPFPQAAEHQQQQQHHQQQQQQQPTYMTIYTPVMVQMTGPSPFASYAASPFAPYANAAPFANTGMVGSDDGSGGAFYHHAPLMASMHGCMPVSMSLIRAATGPLPPSPMLRQTSAPCSGNVLGRTCSAAYSERRSNGGMSNLSRAASGCNNCNGADQQVAYVSMAGGNSGYEVQQRPACRAGNVGCGARYGGRLDGTAESCHHTLNTCEPRSRAECLARYRSKKARRLHTKMIRYHLRKINADNRPRYKGRFVKKGEMLPPTVGEAMPPIVVDE